MRRDRSGSKLSIAIFFVVVTAVIISGCSSSSGTANECYSISQFRKYTSPSFTPYFMNVKTSNGSRIDVYIQIPFNRFRFEKPADVYKASYNLSFIIRNERDDIIQTRDIDRSIETKTYEESVSSRCDGVLQSFSLSPGKYTIEILSTDNLSKLHYRYWGNMIANGFLASTPMASSELYLDTVVIDSKGISLHPIVPELFSLLNDSFGIFQEIYNIAKGDTVTISEIFSTTPVAQLEEESSISHFIPPYRTSQFTCGDNKDSVYYEHDTVFVAATTGMQQVIQFYPLPVIGGSTLTRKIMVSGDTITNSQKLFRRDHRSVSVSTVDEIRKAMRYILTEEEYDSLLSSDMKLAASRINDFWEPRGGIQRLQEFSQKVIEANALFTTCVAGSRTPMGIVYIICGSPDYIDCRGPYFENWYYNIGDRSYPVQFRSISPGKGPGNYELVPFSVNDSMWQYFVEKWRRKK